MFARGLERVKEAYTEVIRHGDQQEAIGFYGLGIKVH